MFKRFHQETPEPVYVGPALLDTALARDHTAFVGQLAYRALQNSRDAQSPTTHRQLEKELSLLARSAIIEALRQLNASTSQSRLPNEIWLEIWGYLTVWDRIHAEQVCFLWRALALNSPRLWRDLDAYHSAVHDDDDDCGCSEYSPCVASDLGLLELVSCRSKSLPLSLHLTVGRFSVRLEDQLSTGLWSVTGRLEFLHLESESTAALGSALSALFDLPKLRRLVISTSDKFFTDRLWPITVNLPALERLEVFSSTPPSVRTRTPHSLPSLKTLRFPFATPGEILGYLKASPQLHTLHLDGSVASNAGAHTWSTKLRDEIRQRAASVSRVSVSGISRAAENAVLALFHLESRSEITLAYRNKFATAQLSGAAIFADLTSPVRLSLTQEGKMLVVQAIGGCGRRREIRGVFDAAELVDAIATRLSAVCELVIDLDLFDALERCQTHWPDVASLTIRLSRAAFISCDLLDGNTSARPWTRLSRLQLEPPDNNFMTVSGYAVQVIARYVHRNYLDTLVLCSVDGVTREALSDLARNVELHARRVAFALRYAVVHA